MMTSSKISRGLYEVKISSGRVFHIEDTYQARGDDGYPRNDWNLFEMHGDDREYCQSFGSKKNAMASVVAAERGEW